MTELLEGTPAVAVVNAHDAPIQRPLARALAQALPGAMLLSAGLLLSPAALAASYQVTSLSDSGSGSLRDAINQANGNAGADTITFASGVSGTISLTSGTLLVTDDLDLQGPGASVLTVDGSGISASPLTGNGTQGTPAGGASVLTIGTSGNNAPPQAQGTTTTNQALASSTVSISGLTISGGSASRGGGIYAYDTDLTVSQCVVSGNTAINRGGGIAIEGYYASLTISGSVISNNTAGYGGGIGIYGAKTTIDRSSVRNNSAAYGGGGILAHTDNPDGPLLISNSTISDNSAGYEGGGVYVKHQAFSISNSTITGNSSNSDGGGIYIDTDSSNYSPTAISNSTITNNQATDGGGGIFLDETDAVLRLSNSVVGGNSAATDADIATASSGPLSASVAADHSLIQDPGSATITDNGGNILNQAPMLGALANNGGPTMTQLPLAGSPLIDAGDPAFSGVANDQRGTGFPRIVNSLVDIGATEYAAAPPVPSGFIAVPGLGDAGKLGLGALLGLAGVAVARRRRGLAPVHND